MKRQKSVLSALLAIVTIALILLGCTCPSPISPPPPPPTQPIGGTGPVMITFTADHTTIESGECATLEWDVRGGYRVELNGQSVSKSEQRRVCPRETTTYKLGVDTGEGWAFRQIEVRASSASLPTKPPTVLPSAAVQIAFTADRTSLKAGECTTLHWTVQAGYQVKLNEQPVGKSGQKQVCPQETTTYKLGVDTGEEWEFRQIEIRVSSAPPPTAKPPTATPTTKPAPPAVTINFWADTTNLMAGNCTILHWDVEHAIAVYLNGNGVAGHATQQVCPPSTTTYTLRVEHAGGVTEKQVTITVTPIPGGGGGGILTADLAVTDLYPDNMPQGSVWVRITNHGHGAVTNVGIQLSVSAVRTEYVGGAKSTVVQAPRSITINLAPGQTAAFDTRLKVNTSQYWYQVTASIQVPFKDPNPSNDSYTETIPPPP